MLKKNQAHFKAEFAGEETLRLRQGNEGADGASCHAAVVFRVR